MNSRSGDGMSLRLVSVLSALLVVASSAAGCSGLDGVMDDASAIGKVVDAPKLKTKQADALLKEIQELNAALDATTGMINTSTETVHAVIAPYKAGEFPVLTKNWETIQAELKKAQGKDKKLAKAQLKTYEDQMAARTIVAAKILENNKKRKALFGKMKVAEVDQLKAAGKKLKEVPDRNQAIADKVPGIMDRGVQVAADLTKQIADNPLSALEGQKLLKKVNKAVGEAKKIPGTAQKQIDAANTLLKLLGDIL